MAFFRKNKNKDNKDISTIEHNKASKPKKRIFRGFSRGVYNTFLNAPSWLSYPILKEQTVGVFGLIKSILFRKFTSNRHESFEQAMLRLNLTETDIKKRTQNIRLQFWLYVAMAVVIAAYSVYLLFATTIVVSLLGFMVTCLCVMKAASMHFWLYQIKQRRLGCTIKDWLGVKPLEEK